MQCYGKRIEMLVGGPDLDMNAKRHIYEIRQRFPNLDTLLGDH
jgi:hypothetical protein